MSSRRVREKLREMRIAHDVAVEETRRAKELEIEKDEKEEPKTEAKKETPNKPAPKKRGRPTKKSGDKK